ncbi:hypothetical protein [Chitiniphilus eburneus]|uniref:Uncharacterized protein n=1 Tax=Chitiniphilus eburneus TaxID=2571148 RepID=A0A4U0PQQ7_9NEIS|nr:hypothetical protein [Chitiniphilus eburneus]TJZ69752.1 hypothetical protein FAZ21_14635 [Chitiniphilus eburneus]
MSSYVPLLQILVLPLIFAGLIKLFALLFKTPMRWLHAIGFAYIAMVSYSLVNAGLMSAGVLLPWHVWVLAGLSLHLAIAVPFFMYLAELRPGWIALVVVLADLIVFMISTQLLVVWFLLINQFQGV